MRKLMIVAAAIAAMAMVGCGNDTEIDKSVEQATDDGMSEEEIWAAQDQVWSDPFTVTVEDWRVVNPEYTDGAFDAVFATVCSNTNIGHYVGPEFGVVREDNTYDDGTSSDWNMLPSEDGYLDPAFPYNVWLTPESCVSGWIMFDYSESPPMQVQWKLLEMDAPIIVEVD